MLALGAALAISIASLNIALENQKRLDQLETLEKSIQQQQQQKTQQTGYGSTQNSNPNVFYSGVDLQELLDKPIFGAPLYGDLDQYDLIHPAILSEGSVLVRGSGRLVLDGDASDLILKIDNEYFSLRELFGIGQGIDSTPRADFPSSSESTSLGFEISQLCSGTVIVPEITCPKRRNFGVDSCYENICYCGAGYDYLTRTYRHRHLICPNAPEGACEDYFIQRNLSAYCCAPGVDTNSYYCNQALNNLTTGITNNKPYFIDRFAECDAFEEGTVCLNVDKNDYLNEYTLADIEGDLLRSPQDLVEVRQKINKHTWGITRDYVFDDGQQYVIQLSNDVFAGCPIPSLKMNKNVEYDKAFQAVWDCDSRGTPLTFSRAKNDLQPGSSSKWGALYYALALADTKDKWYCVTKSLEQQQKDSLVGQVFTTQSNQVFFIQHTEETQQYCASIYLGARDIGDHVMETSLGFLRNDPEKVVVTNPNGDVDMAYSVVPV